MLVSFSASFMQPTSFQSSAVVGPRPLMKVSVTCSSTIGRPSALMLSPGLSIFSWTSFPSSSAPHDARAAAVVSAAVDARTDRRDMGDVIIDSFRLDPSWGAGARDPVVTPMGPVTDGRSEEHASELQSRGQLVCRLLLEEA